MKERDGQLEELLETWSKKPNHEGLPFVRDGILDAKRWDASTVRVLFLLREPNGDYSDWDIRQRVSQEWGGPRFKVWWTAAYWAYLLHGAAAGRVPPFPATESQWESASDALLASAAINVKKRPGGASADMVLVADFARDDADEIRRQVDLIDPHVVVCGNVWDVVRAHAWPEATQVGDLVWRVGEVRFIDFWHPSNQMSDQLTYYALAGVTQVAELFAHPIPRAI